MFPEKLPNKDRHFGIDKTCDRYCRVKLMISSHHLSFFFIFKLSKNTDIYYYKNAIAQKATERL